MRTLRKVDKIATLRASFPGMPWSAIFTASTEDTGASVDVEDATVQDDSV